MTVPKLYAELELRSFVQPQVHNPSRLQVHHLWMTGNWIKRATRGLHLHF